MPSIAGFTGYGYDIVAVVMGIIYHIAQITNTDVLNTDTSATTPSGPIYNVTAPNWEFIAIGVLLEPTNVHVPCLMRNIATGEWAWSRDLIWYEDKHGFVWSGGNYCHTEEEARARFNEYSEGVIWHTEDYRTIKGGQPPYPYLIGGNRMSIGTTSTEPWFEAFVRFMTAVDNGATLTMRIDDADEDGDVYSTRIIIERGVMTIADDFGDEVVIEYDDWMIEDANLGPLVIIKEMGLGISERITIDLDSVAHARIN